jgi:hypothetical protein
VPRRSGRSEVLQAGCRRKGGVGSVFFAGFIRIRRFGFLANRTKKRRLSRCRELLGLAPCLPEVAPKPPQDLLRELTGIDLNRCHRCKPGTRVLVTTLPRG